MKHKQYIAGSGGCFAAGTTVLTPNGYVLIESIGVGDLVTSFDDKGNLQANKVLDTYVHYDQEVFKYTLWGGNTLVATPNHHVLTSENYFCDIGSINESLSLVNTSNLFVPIVSSEYIGKQTVYNLTVESNHTYIANDIRVHNGGGGKGSRTPVDSPDSLKSTSFANIIDLICEGEIEGFAKKDSAQCIYINSLPLKNANGTLNYSEFEYALNTGTPTQQYLPGFDSVESSGVSTTYGKIPKDVPKPIGIPAGTGDRVRVILGIPSLVHYQDNGDTTGSEIAYKIEISRENGPYTLVVDKVFYGKTTSRYQFSHIINLEKLAPDDTFNIRITRLTPDSTSQKLQNDLYLDVATIITDTKLNYPHSAHIGVKIASTQFSSIPTRGYHVKMLKVKLPSNYTPGGSSYEINFNIVSNSILHPEHGLPLNTALVITNPGQITGVTKTDTYYIVNPTTNNYQLSLSPSGPAINLSGTNGSNGNILTLSKYTGIWDGNLTNYAWSNNPAWCFYDLITSKRYGLGEYISEDLVDKWALYSIAKYCDELVPDGYGGMEPRFALNVYIQSKEEAIKVLSDIASAFRAMLFYSNAVITLSQDSNTGASDIQFTNSNVVDGMFTYSGASRKTIHSAALVSWNDPRALYTQKIEYVEDRDAIERYGYNPSELLAFGCTSRGQANRLGKWLLYTENVESNIVSFKSGLEGSYCRPGDIVKVYDEYFVGLPDSGRIISRLSNTSLLLDKPITLLGGSIYKLRVTTLENNSGVESFNTQEYTITTVSGVPVSTISVSTNLDASIGSNFIWSINSTTLTESLFRIVSVKETDDLGIYELVGIKHKPGKFDYIEYGIAFDDDRYSNLSGIPGKIPYEDITYSQGLIQDTTTGAYTAYINIGWKDQLYAASYIIEIKHNEGNWEIVVETDSLNYTINNLLYDNYYSIRLTPVNTGGIKGPSTTFTDIYIYLKADALPTPSNITHSLKNGYIHFEWDDSDALTSPNFSYYEVTLGETYPTSLLGYSSITNKFLDYYTSGMVDDNLDNIFKFWFTTVNKAGVKSVPLVYPITIDNADPITSLIATSATGSIVLDWTLPVDTSELVSTEIWASTTNDRANATLLSGIAIPGTNFLHSITNPNQLSYYYWAKTKNVLEAYSTWYPVSATAGVYGIALVKDPKVPVADITGFTGFSVNAGGLVTPETATLVADISNVLEPTFVWTVNPTDCLVSTAENSLSNPTTNTIIIRPLSDTTSIYVTVTINGKDSNGIPLLAPIVRDYTFPVVYSGGKGEAGQHGVMSAFPSIYTWVAETPPSTLAPNRPGVASTYTWGTGHYIAPAGWYTAAPSNVTPGAVLWRITVPLIKPATEVTSELDWSSSVYDIVSVAMNGLTGPRGPGGPDGASGQGPVSFVIDRDDDQQPTDSEVLYAINRKPLFLDFVTINKGNNGYIQYQFVPGGSIPTEDGQYGHWAQVTLQIMGSLIVEKTITANKLVVTTLDAISADIGHITAGFLDGVVINSSFLTRYTDKIDGYVDGKPIHNYYTTYMRREHKVNGVLSATNNTHPFRCTTGLIQVKAYDSSPSGYTDPSGYINPAYLNRFKSSTVPLKIYGSGRLEKFNTNTTVLMRLVNELGTTVATIFDGIVTAGVTAYQNGVSILIGNTVLRCDGPDGGCYYDSHDVVISGTYLWNYTQPDKNIKLNIELNSNYNSGGLMWASGSFMVNMETANHEEYV